MSGITFNRQSRTQSKFCCPSHYLPHLQRLFLSAGLPFGAIEAVRGAYGSIAQIVDPETDFNLSLKLDLTNFPADEELAAQMVLKVASLRSVVMGAPLREILKHLATRSVAPDADRLVSLMHRPRESYFLIPQPEKVTVVFPMRFKDSNDVILGTSFLQEFMEARRSAQHLRVCGHRVHLSNSKEHQDRLLMPMPVIFPRHVEGDRLDKSVWILSTFYAYVSYHIKCSKAFMHTRMRRRVETLIQVLNRAKPEEQKEKKSFSGRSFRRAI